MIRRSVALDCAPGLPNPSLQRTGWARRSGLQTCSGTVGTPVRLLGSSRPLNSLPLGDKGKQAWTSQGVA
jgi:hypothetical protein